MNDSAKKMKIGILGPFGFGNLGDAAIQEAMIQHIRKSFPEARIIAFSLNPVDTEKRHRISAFPISRTPESDFTNSETSWKNKNLFGKIAGWFQYNSNPIIRKIERVVIRIPIEIFLIFRSYTHLSGLNLLIFSGGGQLDDLWGGPWKHPYVLYKFSLLAKIKGIPSLFASVGLERAVTPIGKFFIKHALSMAQYRSYRDVKSKQMLIAANLDKNAESRVYPDLAHSIEIKVTPSVVPSKRPRSVVGINLIPYNDPRFWPVKDASGYQRYLNKMAAVVEWLIEKNYQLIFLRTDIYVDLSTTDDLFAVLKQKGVELDPDRYSRPDIQSVDDLIEQINQTDYVITSRLHGALLSHRLYIPVLALSYQSKIDMLMADATQSDYCLPIDTFDLETVQKKFLLMEANSAVIKEQIFKRTKECQAALEEQFDQVFSYIR
jgi:polysaccharide pyruvyl transferase WcaK-like protein